VVALATDFNPGTAPSCDITLVGLLARLQMKMSLPEVISAYTVGGSYALRRLHEIGSLQKGKLANFSVLEGAWSEMFYSFGVSPIQQTWRNGKKLKIS
jgi:imidazolonepropionase